MQLSLMFQTFLASNGNDLLPSSLSMILGWLDVVAGAQNGKMKT